MTQPFRLLSRDFVCICLATFLYFGSFYLILPTLPQYVEQLGGTPGQIGLVMGLLSVSAVAVRPQFGRLADRYGRKRLMLVGAGCFSLLFSFYGLLPTVGALYVLRLAHGVAHGCSLAASAAYVADLAPPARRGEVIGVYGTASVIAMALFPAWGIAVIQHTQSFSLLFACAVAASAAAFLAVAPVREIAAQDGGNHAVSLLTIGRRRAVLVPAFALFAAATSYGAVLAFLPVYAPQRGIAGFGVFFTVYAAATLASRVFAGRISDRLGRRRVILPFMALLTAAVFALAFLDGLLMLVVIGFAFGLGFGAFMPILNALVVDKTPSVERGSALGFFTSFMDVGIATGSVLLGLIGEWHGFPVMFFAAALIMLVGMAVFAAFTEKDSPPGAGR